MRARSFFSHIFFAAFWLGASSFSLRAGLIDSSEAQHLSFSDARLTVSGLPWFQEDKPTLSRLPVRLKETFRAPVWSLAQNPSGGRIRFKTDSAQVGIVAQCPNASVRHHMTSIVENGFDVYVNHEYAGSAWPDKDGKIIKEWSVGQAGQLREITLYLPLYKGVTIQKIVLDSKAKIMPPSPFALAGPVVYYGSSITQGGCASNPGLSYQAIVSRWLNVDFVNLGFSGTGLGDPAVARALCEINAACFVLDYWGNPTPAKFKETLPEFVGILRAQFPRTPIIVTGPYYISAESLAGQASADQTEKRKIASEFVENRRKEGDKFISYLDGRKMLSREQAEGLVDGLHANSLGFYFCAKGLERPLRKVLGLKPVRSGSKK